MLLLKCPHCGVEGEETEFHPGGEAHITRVADGDDEAFETYLFARNNPKGVHFERWRHQFGCGKWFHAARSTVSLEVYGVYAADLTTPPPDLLDYIRQRLTSEV